MPVDAAAEPGRGDSRRLRHSAGDVARSATAFDRSAVSVASGLRCGVGVALAVAVALGTGNPTDALDAAVGALFAGVVSLGRPSRPRAFFMALCTVVTALAATAGTLADRVTPADVALLGVLGFVGGMGVCLGTGASAVGVQSITAAVVLGQPGGTLDVALHRGLFTAVGGAVQLALVILPWPVGGVSGERRAVAAAFRSLASEIAGADDGTVRLPGAEALDAARAALAGVQPFTRAGELGTLGTMVEMADRLRTQVIVLIGDLHRLRELGRPHEPPVAPDLASLAGACTGVADAVEGKRSGSRSWPAPPPVPPDGSVASARDHVPDEVDQAIAQVRRTLATMSHILGAALVAARSRPEQGPIIPETGTGSATSARSALRVDAAALRANVSPTSATFRHALRLGVAVALGSALGHLSGSSHGYWVPLTVAIVLRPSFGDTATRGLARVAGTVLGAVLATALVDAVRPASGGTLHPTDPAFVVLVGAVAAVGCTFFRANYGMYATCLTAFVALAVSWAREPTTGALEARCLATAVGGLLAIAIYAAWPTWESLRVGVVLSRLAVAVRRYTTTVLAPWTDPALADPAARRTASAATRRARTDAEASVARMVLEPRQRGPVTARQASDALGAIHAYLVALVSLAEQPLPDRPVAVMATVERHLLDRFDEIARALRGERLDPEAIAPPLAPPVDGSAPSAVGPVVRAWVADLVLTADATAALFVAVPDGRPPAP